MSRIKLLIVALLYFAGVQQVEAQSDIEVTDSISNEWGDGSGGGFNPSIPSEPVTELTLSHTAIAIAGGESFKLKAQVNSMAGNKNVVWSDSNDGIAYMLSDGTVFGMKAGTTTVTASSASNPEITASCSVTVTSDYVAPSSGWIMPWGKEEAWNMKYLYFEQADYKEPPIDRNGKTWKDLDYDDSAWRTLTGPMGSSDIRYSTYNYQWEGEYNCFCLRRTFILQAVENGTYSFSIQHDDDIIVYLNGLEVINSTGYTNESVKTYTISSEYFVSGKNQLAIFIKQNFGGAFLDYALYFEKKTKPSEEFDIGFLPDVPFEFFYDAELYDEATQTIPNHEAAKLAGYNLKLTANIPSYNNGNHLSIENRCEGYIDKWNKGAAESGAYFYRSGSDCMTIVCRVKPQKATDNTSDLIANRGGGYNYMFRVGDQDRFFLHTGTAYQVSRSMELPDNDEPQVLAVRVDGAGDFIQLDNFTTGESKRISGVNWGGSGNVMKFFYNDYSEYYTGDVYWMYYSKEFVSDNELQNLLSYGGVKPKYTITYIIDGDVYKTVKFAEGTVISPEPEPVKEGYTFSGWSEVPATMPAHDITVTGSFTANTYKITYMVDGEVYKTVDVIYGTAITPVEEPQKEGYTFSGWSEVPATMPAHDITVTGSFTANTYKITYLLDGKVYKQVAAKCGDIITPEPEPVKEGYTFSGWEREPLIMPAADVRVTGSFSVNYYKITYILDGEVYMTKVYAYKEEITPVEAPAKEGHTFSGWEGLPETMPTEDLTVTGHYTKNSYKLTYYVDVKRYKSLTLEYGDTITPEPEPTKEGYTFSGWKGLPETMPAKNVTVTGNFTVNTYKITYMVDGEVYATVDVKYGTTITPVEEPQKEGYTFSGWSEIPETMPAHDITVTGSFAYTNIASITTEVVFNVYSLNGTLLYKNVSDIKDIPKGLYIINGRKVLIK